MGNMSPLRSMITPGGMKKGISLALLIAGQVWMSSALLGQAFLPFSDDSRWSRRATDHFEVLFTEGSDESAAWVARYAERALFDLQVMLDFRSESRFTLIYFPSTTEAAASNLLQESALPTPGLFELPSRSAIVIHGEHSRDLYTAVRTAVARLLIEELSFGNSISSIVQNQLLLYLPPWYQEGLSAYLGEGWTPEDESWVAGMETEDLAALALEGQGPGHAVLRKSIWFFIAREYGPHKIAEIVYLVNVNNSVEAGIIHVLGISLPSLTSRWRDFLQFRTQRNEEGRKPLQQVSDLWKMPAQMGKSLLAAVPDLQGNRVAVYVNEGKKNQAYVYNRSSQRLEALPVPAQEVSFGTNPLGFTPAMAWSHDGNQIALTRYRKGVWQIGRLDAVDFSGEWVDLPANVRQVGRIAWSNDDQRLVFSGLVDGFFQIFLLNGSEAVVLTSGESDHIEPTWSTDDQFIFLASNRTDVAEEKSFQAYRNNFDIFKIPIRRESDTLVKLTYTPTISERWPSTPNSFEVAFLTDEAGVLNMARVNIFLNEIHFSTNLAHGPVWAWMSDQTTSFLLPEGNYLSFYQAPTPAVAFTGVPNPSLIRQEYLVTFQEEIQKEQYYRILDRKSAEVAPVTPTQPASTPAKPDSAKTSPAVRFYFFDDDDTPYTPPAAETQKDNRAPTQAGPAKKLDPAKRHRPPGLESIAVGLAESIEKQWLPTHAGLNYGFDPVAGWNIGLQVGFRDMLRRHQLLVEARPFVNFRNSDYQIQYGWMKNRLDVFGRTSFSTRSFSESFSARGVDSLLFRYQDLRFEGGIGYPVTTNLYLFGDVGFHIQNRIDQKLRRLSTLDQRQNLAYARAGVRYNRTERTEYVVKNGFFLNGQWESLYSLTNGAMAFSRIQAQFRGYRPLARNLVFATQVSAGLNVPNQQRQYLMGGVDQWMFGVRFDGVPDTDAGILLDPDVFSFSYRQLVMPVRGFSPLSRAGTRYFIWNSELRIPITRIIQQSLNSNRLYNFELIPFFDAGTTWVSGNPFSQKNPTETQFLSNGAVSVELQTLRSPFLMGFGSGFRMNLVGYSVRLDLAWGIEDNTLQAPMLVTSLGKTF